MIGVRGERRPCVKASSVERALSLQSLTNRWGAWVPPAVSDEVNHEDQTPRRPTDTPIPAFPTLNGLPPYVSPTLQNLPRPAGGRHPRRCAKPVRGRCGSLSPEGTKCYCRVMHLVSWASEEPNVLTHCDGEVMANLERVARLAQETAASA